MKTKHKVGSGWAFKAISMLAVMFFFGGSVPTYAATGGPTTVDRENTQMSKANSLVLDPNAAPQTPTVSVEGTTKWHRENGQPNDKVPSSRVVFDSYDAMHEATSITANYKNVGSYMGKTINGQIKITDLLPGDVPVTLWGTGYWFDFINMMTVGMNYNRVRQFNMTFSFTYADTGEPVNVTNDSTWITFNTQNGGSDKIYTEYSAYEKMGDLPFYVTPGTIEQYMDNPVTNSGKVMGGRYDLPNTEATSERPQYLIDKANRIKAKYPDLSTKDYNAIRDYGFIDDMGQPTFTDSGTTYQVQGNSFKFLIGNGLGRAWTSFSSATLWNPTPDVPIKKVVQPITNASLDGTTVTPGTRMEYTVTQNTQKMNQDILESYSEFSYTDQLPSEVEYTPGTAYVTDQAGKKYTQGADTFTENFDQSSNKLVVSAAPNMMKDTFKYTLGESYTLHVPVTVKNVYSGTGQLENTATVTINNKPQTSNKVTNNVPVVGKIQVTKVDASSPSKGLSGAIYTVKDASGKVVGTVTTDENGGATTSDLPLGTYTVVETKAPQGYQLDTTTYTAKLDGSSPVVKLNGGTVSDKPQQVIPETGSTTLAVTLGLIVMAAIGSVILLKKRKSL